MGEATGLAFDGGIFTSVAEALRAAQADVVIDYTSATAVRESVAVALEAGSHVVIAPAGSPPRTTSISTAGPARPVS